MDAFYASVEVLDDPALAGRPVVVGGTGRRGVVASCTYEARAWGVRSAMSSVEARRRCPHAVVVPGRFWRYQQVSDRLQALLRSFTPVVEPLGLDEAFLDVAGVRRLLGPPPAIAASIRVEVARQLGLQCSVGVARTKLLAKLASRAAKPQAGPGGVRLGPGVVVVAPEDELAFLHPLPVRALWGVGPSTAQRLERVGILTVGQLAAAPEASLRRLLGSALGGQLALLARGVDPRGVEPRRVPKSVGHEETFPHDLLHRPTLHRHVVRLADAVSARLDEAGLAGRTVALKVRFADRSTRTRTHTARDRLVVGHALSSVANDLLDVVLDGPCPPGGIRLLGVAVSGLVPAASAIYQLSFDAGGSGWNGPGLSRGLPATARCELDGAVAAIRARFGPAAVGPATLAGPHGLDVKRRGDTQWGPAAAVAGMEQVRRAVVSV